MKAFFHQLIISIMKFFKKVGAWFKRLFTNIKKFLKENVAPAVKFVNAIKTVVDNPALDVLVAFTKTDLDNKILAKLRQALSQAVDILEVQLECGSKGTDDEKIACYINWLRSLPKEQRNAMYAKTASIIARIQAGNTLLRNSQIDMLVQLEYTEQNITEA